MRRFGIASAPAGVPGTHSWRSLGMSAPPPTPFSGMAWTSLAGATLFGGTHFSQAAATEQDSATTAPRGLLVKLFLVVGCCW